MIGIIWYRTKVLRVLRDQFSYEPDVPGWQMATFNSLTRTIRKQKGNEFDAAIAFMFVQLDLITPTEENRSFRFELVNNACFASKKSKLPITRETAMALFREYDEDFFQEKDK